MQRSSRFGLLLSVSLFAAASAAHFSASHAPRVPQTASLSGPIPFDRVMLRHVKEEDDAGQGDLRSLNHDHD